MPMPTRPLPPRIATQKEHSEGAVLGHRSGADCRRALLTAAMAGYATDVAVTAVLSPVRGDAQAAFARQIAMYLAHTAFEMSIARVAVAFGRDRSTVAYACHRIEDRRDDPGFDAAMEALEVAVRAAPGPGMDLAQ